MKEERGTGTYEILLRYKLFLFVSVVSFFYFFIFLKKKKTKECTVDRKWNLIRTPFARQEKVKILRLL